MKEALKKALDQADKAFSSTYIKMFDEKNSLMSFLFHGIFNNLDELKANAVDPQQSITVDHFRQYIEYFLNAGYTFVSPDDILQGLDPGGKYIFTTFDDGYYSNRLIVPILQEYKVPAVFYISANHVSDFKGFWWDILYRERMKEGKTEAEIRVEQEGLKQYTNDQIEQYLVDCFGLHALQPVSDLDRTFTIEELAEFAKEPYVFIGNHTHNHAILTNYDRQKMYDEIHLAQERIHEMTGIWSNSIAYPNGNFSKDVIDVSKEVGLTLGITTIHKKNYFPLDLTTDEAYTLNRFTLWGNHELSIERQCDLYRSDIHLKTMLKQLIKG